MTDNKKRETLIETFKKTAPLWKEVVKDGEQAKIEVVPPSKDTRQ